MLKDQTEMDIRNKLSLVSKILALLRASCNKLFMKFINLLPLPF